MIVIVKLHEHLNSVTVDRLLLLTNSFHEWYRINLFVAPNSRNKNLDYLVNAMLQTFEASLRQEIFLTTRLSLIS